MGSFLRHSVYSLNAAIYGCRRAWVTKLNRYYRPSLTLTAVASVHQSWLSWLNWAKSLTAQFCVVSWEEQLRSTNWYAQSITRPTTATDHWQTDDYEQGSFYGRACYLTSAPHPEVWPTDPQIISTYSVQCKCALTQNVPVWTWICDVCRPPRPTLA